MAKSADNKAKNDAERFNYDKQYAANLAIIKVRGLEGNESWRVGGSGGRGVKGMKSITSSEKTSSPFPVK